MPCYKLPFAQCEPHATPRAGPKCPETAYRVALRTQSNPAIIVCDVRLRGVLRGKGKVDIYSNQSSRAAITPSLPHSNPDIFTIQKRKPFASVQWSDDIILTSSEPEPSSLSDASLSYSSATSESLSSSGLKSSSSLSLESPPLILYSGLNTHAAQCSGYSGSHTTQPPRTS
jgi:hypothetical protein